MKKQRLMLGAAVMLAATALGQKDSSLSSLLNDVTVTANRVTQKQSQTGKVVSVIGKAELERAAGKSLAQLLNEQAGITVNGANGNLGTNQTLYMRGAGAGRTLVLLDGIPMYDPSLINSEFDLNLISIYDIERIEVCRGAQSTLYGSDAIAGVINIITTKKDAVKPVNFKAVQTAGNYGTYRSHLQLFGKKDRWQYNAKYSLISSQGFSSANDKAGAGNFDNDFYKASTASASSQYQVTKGLSVKGFGQYTRYRTELDGGAFIDDKDYRLKNENTVAGLQVLQQWSKAKLHVNYQFSNTERNFLNDSGSISGFSKFERSNFNGSSHFVESYAQIPLHPQLQLIAGMDLWQAKMNSDYLSISSFGPFKTSFPNNTMGQWSTYASLMYSSKSKRLNAEGGLRFTNHSVYGSKVTYTLNPSFEFAKRWRAFGSIASGFKAPSLYQLYAGPGIGNTNLEAETATNYEVGLQYSNSTLSARALYYHRSTDNGIDYLGFPANPSGYFNFINQTGSGVELEARVVINAKLSSWANYSLLDANESTQSRLNAKDTSYSYLLRRPKHQFNVGLSYIVIPRLETSIALRYSGKRFDVGGFRRPDLTLDAYAVCNWYTAYKIGNKLKVFADIQNLFNTKFYDAAGFNATPFLCSAGVVFNL